MNNFAAMYRFEVRKMMRRKITAIVLTVVILLMVAMNIGEYVAGSRIVNKEEQKLSGRAVDDVMLDEMRQAIEPTTLLTESGEKISVGMEVKDEAYRPLMEYLKTIAGNIDKAYNLTESVLETRFNGVVDDIMRDQQLTEKETEYWNIKKEETEMPLIYGRLQNGWGDSVCIIYVVSILSMISIASTLSGVFSDEMQLKTDAIIYSSKNGKKRLGAVKILAGTTVGLIETLIILTACAVTEFAISGFGGGETSVQFFFGPTAMDMPIRKVFFVYTGLALIIGVLMSEFAMCLSQLFHNSVAVIAVMMGFWLISMLTPPYRWRFISQILGYMPVTFLGSWTFSDYRTVGVFGKLYNILEVAPVLYLALSLMMVMITLASYKRYEVKGM